ncbi:ribosome small subunit-dependent GTPase A [Vibrio sp. F13]|uniref:ribosome small subunit-dependent GTPase A n=1 Tax=unclassified Vibrio TaxID=2614977 RepID=UPI0010BD0B54|nr:ribosome small subunit-dependent GTPase A [Vibrio sp. F13]TKF89897.1 ribosome small subunit-dependent GTPase A [Vibrio sp. F13]
MNSQNAFSHPMSLQQLGWQPVFQQQLTLEDYDHSVIARIVAHHRNGYTLASEQGEIVLPIHQNQPAMTVGDWVILNSELQFDRLLERQSLFSRKAAGSRVAEQYISANIDTVFIVVSLNNDFNLSRIERYLALANEAQVEAVIVLTKKDLCDDYEGKVQQVQSLDPMLMIEAVNSLDQGSTQVLSPWCKTGKTVALMGSSGVGKSTLVNSLLGQASQATGGIREDDSKGRHTTTSRSLHLLASGGLLLDTPGMRELQLADCAEGVSETFSDVEELAMHCRFSDCSHESEPGCTIRKAIESGELSERRFSNYEKLLREQARNGASLAEQRANSKQLSKMYKTVQSESRNIKKSSK